MVLSQSNFYRAQHGRVDPIPDGLYNPRACTLVALLVAWARTMRNTPYRTGFGPCRS